MVVLATWGCDAGVPDSQKIRVQTAAVAAVAQPVRREDAGPPKRALNLSEYDNTDVSNVWAAAVRTEVAHRTLPILAIQHHVFAKVGRCAVEVTARGFGDADFARAAFTARNEAGFELATNELNGSLQSAMRPRPPQRPTSAFDRAAAVAEAASFMVLNMELFDLEADDLTRATVMVKRESNPREQYVFDVRGKRPEVGFESFRSMDREIFFGLTIRSDGEVTDVGGRVEEVRGVDICTDPKITSAQAASHVIGQELTLDTNTGRRSAGKIKRENVRATTLTFYRMNLPNPSRTMLRLAYEVTVVSGSITYTFMVDADTGNTLSYGYNAQF